MRAGILLHALCSRPLSLPSNSGKHCNGPPCAGVCLLRAAGGERVPGHQLQVWPGATGATQLQAYSLPCGPSHRAGMGGKAASCKTNHHLRSLPPTACRSGCRLAAEAAVQAWPERCAEVAAAKAAAQAAAQAAADAKEAEEQAAAETKEAGKRARGAEQAAGGKYEVMATAGGVAV